MDKEYKATYNYLFDKEDNLFYRDHRYFTMKEANGAKVFWGRGNGWVLGGLVEMLRELPAKSKYRPFYQDLFLKLCRRIAPLQGKDGFWHASLLDPASYPSPETSCSGFFVYALAYGINEGLLPKEEFLPVVEKGWQALCRLWEKTGNWAMCAYRCRPQEGDSRYDRSLWAGELSCWQGQKSTVWHRMPRNGIRISLKAVSVKLLLCCPINRKEWAFLIKTVLSGIK